MAFYQSTAAALGAQWIAVEELLRRQPELASAAVAPPAEHASAAGRGAGKQDDDPGVQGGAPEAVSVYSDGGLNLSQQPQWAFGLFRGLAAGGGTAGGAGGD